jgi:hypothetical protein
MYKFDNAGNADILIRAISNTKLLGTTYVPGDIVAIFENAFFNISFVNSNKLITQGAKNLLHFNSMAPTTLSIENKSLKTSSYNFLAVSKSQDVNISVPVKENILSDNEGNVFLTKIPINTKPIFIKNSQLENIENYTVDYITGQITGLPNSTGYICYYYYQDINLISYSLDKVETPYFQIEILGDGNVNGISRKVLINIPKASIDVQTLIEFAKNKIASADIVFGIIDGMATITYY